ncbi:hypothetical protein SDC9_102229 [bioreactor metagenome]|uniref:Uncharacterized protein n=1 Tax=bioreactor metagenome TaxID=1076179 RepID=A0A645AQ95_9ZZZZ
MAEQQAEQLPVIEGKQGTGLLVIDLDMFLSLKHAQGKQSSSQRVEQLFQRFRCKRGKVTLVLLTEGDFPFLADHTQE